ncbi:hypothetical protein E2C01_029680 [Portunus trituberculatus]|uniref:Uncharacterized protein n=1 Tax=Portunus trituberculatus TaxID=210409 RepID=A0A5B7ENK5_PORTR|nr:hypothetical protein [Portunus trituberculatus]
MEWETPWPPPLRFLSMHLYVPASPGCTSAMIRSYLEVLPGLSGPMSKPSTTEALQGSTAPSEDSTLMSHSPSPVTESGHQVSPVTTHRGVIVAHNIGVSIFLPLGVGEATVQLLQLQIASLNKNSPTGREGLASTQHDGYWNCRRDSVEELMRETLSSHDWRGSSNKYWRGPVIGQWTASVFSRTRFINSLFSSRAKHRPSCVLLHRAEVMSKAHTFACN